MVAHSGIARRSFLQAGALAAGAGAAGVLLGRQPSADAAVTAFNVNGTPNKLFYSATLSNPHESWQAIAWDGRHGRLFYTVPPHDPQDEPGQTRISYLDLSGNAPANGAHMDFYGFNNGHGIGIQYIGGDDVYIWMASADNTKLCRFRWTGSGLYRYSGSLASRPPGFQEFTPVPGAQDLSVATDIAYDNLMLRYEIPGAGRSYRTYRVADVAAGKTTTVTGTTTVHESTIFAGIHEPSYEPKDVPNYQGHVLYGAYAYVLSGRQWYKTPDEFVCEPYHHRQGDVHLTRFDTRTGAAVNSATILADRDINNREPEGVAVVQTSGGARLVFGLLRIPDCDDNKTRRMDALAIG